MQQPNSCQWCRKLPTPQVYEPHSTRNCPALAAVQCPCCAEFGHTAKHCATRRHARRHRPRAHIEGGARRLTAKFAKSTPPQTNAHITHIHNRFSLQDTASHDPLPAQDDRFECEECGFQHSCEEIVAEHEKSCLGQDARAAMPHLVWADCSSDEEIAPPNFDDQTTFPGLTS